MINIYAAVAQEERRMISDRTKAGLRAAKERGVMLGGPALPEINSARLKEAAARAQAIAPLLADLASLSARAAADELNKRAVGTPTGAPWSAKTVIRVRERLQHASPRKRTRELRWVTADLFISVEPCECQQFRRNQPSQGLSWRRIQRRCRER
jgi:DNA invertase Pin-like site-specific DNA recombinase